MDILAAEGGNNVDWLSLLQTFGLAVSILIALAVGAWRVLKWAGKELVIPFRDQALARFVIFLTKIEVTIGKLDLTVAKLDVNVDHVIENLDKQTKAMESIEELTRAEAKTLEKASESDARKESSLEILKSGQSNIKSELSGQLAEVRGMVKVIEGKIDSMKKEP